MAGPIPAARFVGKWALLSLFICLLLGATFVVGSAQEKPTLTPVSKDSTTIAGEAIGYPDFPNPEVSSGIMTIPPGTVTQWMTHPVPLYIYVLEGDLTVEFADGSRRDFSAGQGFLQSRTKWHRGRNDSQAPARFLAVFFGAKDVPNVLNPPGPDAGHASH